MRKALTTLLLMAEFVPRALHRHKGARRDLECSTREASSVAIDRSEVTGIRSSVKHNGFQVTEWWGNCVLTC